MDEEHPKLERSNRVLGRILIACVITVILAELTCLVPAGRPPDPEFFIAGLIVLYGAALIAVCRGWFDFLNDTF